MAIKVKDTEQKERTVPEIGEVGQRIAQKVGEEALRAQEAEQALQEAVSEEAERAKQAENSLALDISTESNRAEEAEALLQQAIETESSRAQSAEEQLETNLASEVNRATGAESALRTDLNSEISRAQGAEGSLQSAIQSESTARQQSDEELEGRISDVESEVALKQNSIDNSLQTSSKTITGAINENKTEIDGLRADMIAQDHNKGFAQTAADVLTISADLNDFVYCIETSTIWVYGEDGWADSGEPYPSDATPLSTSTPLMDGQAEVGTSSSAARADHRHPTDTSRASDADLQAEILARQSGDTTLQTELDLKLDSQGGDAKDTVVTFTDLTGTASNVASGDKTSTLWGKVKNWFSRLKALAFKNKVAAGDFEAGAIKNADVAADAAIAQSKVSGLQTDYVASIEANGRTVSYKNKNGVVINSFTTQDTTYNVASQSSNGLMSSTDKTKLDGIESGAQKNTVLGVKGSSESTYRTGNVNITKANIGLSNVDNTSDEDKPISTATQIALNNETAARSAADTNLQNQIDDIKDGTTVVGKASADADGNPLIASHVKNINGTDFNNYTETGLYEIIGNSSNPMVNMPISTSNLTATNGNWYLWVFRRGSTYITQVAYSVRFDNAIAIRSMSNGEWGEWRTISEQGVTPQAEVANSVDAINMNNANIDDYWGVDYWGRFYVAAGGSQPDGAPTGVAGGGLFIQQIGVSSTLQIYVSQTSSSGSASPTMWQRSHNASSWTAWQELVTADGSYPTLGAGHLPYVELLRGATGLGWSQIGSISTADMTTSNTSVSVILLINGIWPDQNTGNTAGQSGIIEVDFRTQSTAGAGFDYVRVSILSGNLQEDEICAVISGTEAYVYYDLNENYESIQVVKLAESTTNTVINAKLPVFKLTSIVYGTSAPSGAVYAVNRNVAAKGVTPATDSNSDDVATTEWVRDLLNGLTITRSRLLSMKVISSEFGQTQGGAMTYPAVHTFNIEDLAGDVSPFSFGEVIEANATSPLGATATISSDGKSVTLRYDAPEPSTSYALSGNCKYTVLL